MSHDINDEQYLVIADLAAEVVNERLAQLGQWGEQNHPYVYDENARRNYTQLEARWKNINTARVAAGSISWDGILLEEVYEALAATDAQHMRDELVQVAAVALAAAEAIDRELNAQAEARLKELAELPRLIEDGE